MVLSGKSIATIFAVIFAIYFLIFLYRGTPTSYTSQEAFVTSSNFFLIAVFAGIIAVVFCLIALNMK